MNYLNYFYIYRPRMYIFQQIQGIWRDLAIILKILKNTHFRNHKIQLSRAVWSVSLLRPHSGRHTETAIIDNYFVFQDLQFPFLSIFFKLLSNPFKSLEIVENDTSEARIYRNIENHKNPSKPLIKYPEESNSSNFELHRAKHKKSIPMQIIPPQKPTIYLTYPSVLFRASGNWTVGVKDDPGIDYLEITVIHHVLTNFWRSLEEKSLKNNI